MSKETTIKEPAPRSLRDMYNRPTRYEVVAVIPTGTFRIGFTSWPSKTTLLGFAREHNANLLPFVGEDAIAKYSRAGGWTIGPDVTVKLSGRTERDVRSAEKT